MLGDKAMHLTVAAGKACSRTSRQSAIAFSHPSAMRFSMWARYGSSRLAFGRRTARSGKLSE